MADSSSYLKSFLSLSAMELSKARPTQGIFCSCMYFIMSCFVLRGREERRGGGGEERKEGRREGGGGGEGGKEGRREGGGGGEGGKEEEEKGS